MAALARAETHPFQKAEYERLSLSYLRLATKPSETATRTSCMRRRLRRSDNLRPNSSSKRSLTKKTNSRRLFGP